MFDKNSLNSWVINDIIIDEPNSSNRKPVHGVKLCMYVYILILIIIFYEMFDNVWNEYIFNSFSKKKLSIPELNQVLKY